jgi:hypothetical protein
MKRLKMTLEVEVRYDDSCDMGYVYLVPREAIQPAKGRAYPAERNGQVVLVADFRDEGLVGIEVFGKARFPKAIRDALEKVKIVFDRVETAD